MYPGFDRGIKFCWFSGLPTGPQFQMILTSLAIKDAKTTLSYLYPPYVDFEAIKSWVQKCREQHGKCCVPAAGNLVRGLKVVDCKSRTIIALPADSEYLALSYVWGQAHSLPIDESRILSDDVPAAVEHSMMVTLALGYQYLWIDRYVRQVEWPASNSRTTVDRADFHSA